MPENSVRINKYLADAGLCSRREADRFIEAGLVLIDGVPAEAGSRVSEGSAVTFRGKPVERKRSHVILAYNKPKGLICSTTGRQGRSIMDEISYPTRIYPVGRLDKDSTGLILLTDNGDIVNRILKGSNYHEKEYRVRINKPVTDDFLRKMAEGVYLEELDTTTRECRVNKTGPYTFDIVLTQGLNRQIRRMCIALGARVVKLKRVRIINILLGDLPEGSLRELTEEEQSELFRLTGYEEGHER